MNDTRSSEWDKYRPRASALEVIDHCLLRLDDDLGHAMTDTLVPGLTFQELIGALLLGRDAARRVEEGTAPSTECGL